MACTSIDDFCLNQASRTPRPVFAFQASCRILRTSSYVSLDSDRWPTPLLASKPYLASHGDPAVNCLAYSSPHPHHRSTEYPAALELLLTRRVACCTPCRISVSILRYSDGTPYPLQPVLASGTLPQLDNCVGCDRST
jgi:hypothetical protein